MAATVEPVTARDVDPDFIALPRRYRIDRIRRDLGYHPIRSFEEGMAEIRAYPPSA